MINRIKSNLIILLIFIFYHAVYSQSGWILQNSHTNMDLKDVFFVNADTGWAVGYYGTILKTIDGGEHWSLQTRRITANLTSVFFANPNTGWIVGENSTILHTTDCGENWTSQSIDTTNARLLDVFFVNDNIGWIANYSENSATNSLYKTTDGGAHWLRQVVIWSKWPRVNTFFFLDENTGWVANHGVGIGITFDGGNSWTVLENNGYRINSICFVNDTLGWVNHSPDGVFKTTDGGNTWFHLDSQPIGWGIDVYFIDEMTGWATGGFGMDSSVVMYTTDGGDSWSIQLEYPFSNINYFGALCFIDSAIGWVVGSGGTIFKTTTGGITSVDNNKIKPISPVKFELFQNYPNPFNPSTTINYIVRAQNLVPQQVNLSIYNILGQKVVTLVNGRQNAGEHQVQWQADGLPSGIYLAQLQAGSQTKTIKLLLQK